MQIEQITIIYFFCLPIPSSLIHSASTPHLPPRQPRLGTFGRQLVGVVSMLSAIRSILLSAAFCTHP